VSEWYSVRCIYERERTVFDPLDQRAGFLVLRQERLDIDACAAKNDWLVVDGRGCERLRKSEPSTIDLLVREALLREQIAQVHDRRH